MVKPADGCGRTDTTRPLADIRTLPRRQRARRVTLWRAPGIALLTVAAARERPGGEDADAAPCEVSTAER